MRLARLHIAGFKSFPDRAELGFDSGVTAIVGPNGCGKSNVVDAITWVLGEQSAKSLRGERMEDVIFNGSDARKPTATAEVRLKLTQVAQVGLAVAVEVEDLLLDSAPIITRDVEIGRRLYRSGESEYLIDGEVCRLRDLHDLLMDSGLGVKAYAVIEQGKIGQILSSRPAERRMLIEEAAGVTKYKSRRRAAELKLDAARQNLTRIDDIIFEIDKQRGALKRQAARARRYKRLREELRTWEQVQMARRYAALRAEIEVAAAELEAARLRENVAVAGLAEHEAALEAVRLHLVEAESAATGARERAHAHELEIGRRGQQIEFDRRRIEDFAAQARTMAEEVGGLEARRGPATDAIATQRAAAATALQGLEAASADVRTREAAYGEALSAAQVVERESDTTRAAVLGAGTTLAALRQAREHAATARDRAAAERERFEIEARDLAAEAAAAGAAREAAASSLVRAQAALADITGSKAEADRALVDARAAREQAAERHALHEHDVTSKEARLRSLDELEASRATFGDAARFLLADTPTALHAHGAVADHLLVERSYERAVDALLGEVLQHVLVDRPADVTTACALLAERHAGRCGFFVLQEAGGHAPAEPPLIVPPGARALASVVRPTGPYAQALVRLIGRALIVDSFEAAQATSRAVSVPVASMAGDVFRGAWLVEAGAQPDARGVLEARAEVAALREEVDAKRVAGEALRHTLRSHDEQVLAAESAVAALVERLHAQEKSIVALEAHAVRTGEDHTRITRRLDLVVTERARAKSEQDATEHRREEATAAIETHEARHREAEENLGAVLARLQAARDEADLRLRLVTESRTTHATLVERTSALEAEVRRLEEARVELETRLEGRRTDIRRTEERSRELAQTIVEAERVLDEEIGALETLKVELRSVDERVVVLRESFAREDHDIRIARHDLDLVRARVTECEVARAKSAADLAHLGETCTQTVGTSLDEVTDAVAALEAADGLIWPGRRLSADAAEEEDEADAGTPDAVRQAAAVEEAPAEPSNDPDQAIEILRKRLDRLGPVNMMAIEQFDELETRHAFLTTQRKDLVDSITKTGDAIAKIDVTTRERFAVAFQSINTHFEHTFTTLFGGGRAGLVLIDQENDPESGIDIIAQPPGKRLQNVQLLSGGEKALTAMALMFAVFKYRPSPFCLLDEIDAPLDDANIGRFIEMLQGMQAHTQFILITHNRKTMEIANRLYGVTMEEPGVSKLISLQLN